VTTNEDDAGSAVAQLRHRVRDVVLHAGCKFLRGGEGDLAVRVTDDDTEPPIRRDEADV